MTLLRKAISIVSINWKTHVIHRVSRLYIRSGFYSTSENSNYSLNLFDAGIIKHASSKADELNRTRSGFSPYNDEYEIYGNISTYKRKINRRSSLLNRKNKHFLGDHL